MLFHHHLLAINDVQARLQALQTLVAYLDAFNAIHLSVSSAGSRSYGVDARSKRQCEVDSLAGLASEYYIFISSYHKLAAYGSSLISESRLNNIYAVGTILSSSSIIFYVVALQCDVCISNSHTLVISNLTYNLSRFQLQNEVVYGQRLSTILFNAIRPQFVVFAEAEVLVVGYLLILDVVALLIAFVYEAQTQTVAIVNERRSRKADHQQLTSQYRYVHILPRHQTPESSEWCHGQQTWL